MTATRNAAGGIYAVAMTDKRQLNRPTLNPTGKTQAQRRLERMNQGALALPTFPFRSE